MDHKLRDLITEHGIGYHHVGTYIIFSVWRIRDPVPFSPLDPGWIYPKSYFLELRNIFWVKILKFFDADADPGSGNFFYPIREPG
jgi:hypothetical protein